MSKIFNNELTVHYSFKGHKWKQLLINLKLNKVILDAVRIYDSDVSIKDIEIAVSIWLTKTCEHLKRQEKEEEVDENRK